MNSWPWRKIHISWLVASWSFGAVVGVILSARAQLSGFVSVIWSIIGLLILVPLLFKQRRSMIVLVVISGLIIGLWRGGLGQIGLDDY